MTPAQSLVLPVIESQYQAQDLYQLSQNLSVVRSATGVRNVYTTRRAGIFRVSVTSRGHRYDAGPFDSLPAADQAARALRDRLFTHHTR